MPFCIVVYCITKTLSITAYTKGVSQEMFGLHSIENIDKCQFSPIYLLFDSRLSKSWSNIADVCGRSGHFATSSLWPLWSPKGKDFPMEVLIIKIIIMIIIIIIKIIYYNNNKK